MYLLLLQVCFYHFTFSSGLETKGTRVFYKRVKIFIQGHCPERIKLEQKQKNKTSSNNNNKKKKQAGFDTAHFSPRPFCNVIFEPIYITAPQIRRVLQTDCVCCFSSFFLQA